MSATDTAPWTHGRLGDLLPIKYGKSLPDRLRDSNGTVPVFGSSGRVGVHTEALTEGPALIVGRKGSVGSVYFSEVPCWPIDTVYFTEAAAGQNLRYFKYLLDSLRLVQLDKSTAIPGLSRDDYNALTVAIAPPQQQAEIVAEIEKQFSRLDEAVANLQRVKANLKRYKAVTLKAAVEGNLVPTEAEQVRPSGRPFENACEYLKRILAVRQPVKAKTKRSAAPTHALEKQPPAGWVATTLGELATFSFYGPRFSSDDYSTSGAFVLRTSDIDDAGRVDVEAAPRIALSAGDLERYRLQPGDMLVTRTGSLGRVALFADQVDAIPGAYLIQLRLDLEWATRKYLLLALKSPAGQAHLTGGGAGVGRPNLNAPTIEAFPVQLPPLAEQERIVAEVDRRMSIVREVEAEVDANLKRAQALRQAVLARAFQSA